MIDNFVEDAAKKMKNSQQDAKADAETAQIMQRENPVQKTSIKQKKR